MFGATQRNHVIISFSFWKSRNNNKATLKATAKRRDLCEEYTFSIFISLSVHGNLSFRNNHIKTFMKHKL